MMSVPQTNDATERLLHRFDNRDVPLAKPARRRRFDTPHAAAA